MPSRRKGIVEIIDQAGGPGLLQRRGNCFSYLDIVLRGAPP